MLITSEYLDARPLLAGTFYIFAILKMRYVSGSLFGEAKNKFKFHFLFYFVCILR